MGSTKREKAVRTRARRAGRARRGREGIVLVIVMLVIVVSTATAAISVRSTQAELHSAGQQRLLRQTRAGSEAAMTTTIAWIDMLGNSAQLLDVWQTWTLGAPPRMHVYAEPEIQPFARHMAGRAWAKQQRALSTVSTGGSNPNSEVPVLGPLTVSDTMGSFGPGQAYSLSTVDAYSVDLTDCFRAPSGSSPGAPLGTGSGSLVVVQFYCVLTSHFSLRLGTNADKVDWTLGSNTYEQPKFARLSDSRATILTPGMLVAQ
jgi:hypothetical protein